MKKKIIMVLFLFVMASGLHALECKINDNWSKMTFYENGKKKATWLYYDFGLVKEGSPISGYVTVTAKSGDENITGHFDIVENSIVNRVYKFYYEEYGLYASGKFVDDYMQGVWTYYHTTGKIAVEGVYNRNMKEGYWAFYDEKGYKEKEIYFEKDAHDLENETDAFDWVKKKLMHLGEIVR